MLQTKELSLKGLGILQPLNLLGSLEILNEEPNSHIVFLIDEEHHNINCIENNVKNAIELIKNADVKIIGVESHSGGKQWDEYDQVYIDDEHYDYRIVNTCPDFANELSKTYNEYIYGVECEGMLNKIQCNLSVDDNQYFGIPIAEHPLNKERSKHFVQTLFEKRKQLNLKGNLILNCGTNHNTHIAEWIINGEIEQIVGYKSTYIRLNTIEKI
jgi:hypothetical protein